MSDEFTFPYWSTRTGGRFRLAPLSLSETRDNSDALSFALNHQYAVVIPPGTYSFATPIVCPPNAILIGYGAGISKLNFTGAGVGLSFYSTDFFASIVNTGRIQDLTLSATSAAAGILSISESYRFLVQDCQFFGATAGFGVQLRNRTYWTEGVRLVRCVWRNCNRHFVTTVDDHTIDGTLSFAETSLEDCSMITAGKDDCCLDFGSYSFVYGGHLNVKINHESDAALLPTTDRCTLVRAGSAVNVEMDWQILEETNTTRKYWKFDLADNAQLLGSGFFISALAAGMSDALNAPYASIRMAVGASLYTGASGQMCRGSGVFGNTSRLGAGQLCLAALLAPDPITSAVLYLQDETFEVALKYVGTGRAHSMNLFISPNKGATNATSASASSIKIASERYLGASPVFDPSSRPFLAFSTTTGCAFLFIPMINTVSDGVLTMSAEIKNYVNVLSQPTDYDIFRPLIFAPDTTGITFGANYAVATAY